ncbi:hypothetical protein CI610_01036 [invertebrate metagenome]|uniref:SGNH hydrolase-type esterase domain-containing protein n=1 Tax=invertebrate metagenome TaxID=1711999 RepID=A0A2H9T9V0_9ZZZZ
MRNIFFVGDSITLGKADSWYGGWPARVCRELGDVNACYNLGKLGDACIHLQNRWKGEVTERIQPEADHVLVFSFGVAGTLQGVPMDNQLLAARRIIEEAKQLNFPVAWVGPTCVADEAATEKLIVLSEHFAELAEILHVPYIPMAPILKDNPDYQSSLKVSDGIHPQDKGYDIIARRIVETGILK